MISSIWRTSLEKCKLMEYRINHRTLRSTDKGMARSETRTLKAPKTTLADITGKSPKEERWGPIGWYKYTIKWRYGKKYYFTKLHHFTMTWFTIVCGHRSYRLDWCVRSSHNGPHRPSLPFLTDMKTATDLAKQCETVGERSITEEPTKQKKTKRVWTETGHTLPVFNP